MSSRFVGFLMAVIFNLFWIEYLNANYTTPSFNDRGFAFACTAY
jgi:hypothetical protein